MKRYSGVLILLSLLIFSGCATGPKEAEINHLTLLENQVARVLAELSVLQNEIKANRSAIAEMKSEYQAVIEQNQGSTSRNATKLDSIGRKISALTERVDDSELRINTLRKELSSVRLNATGTVYTNPGDYLRYGDDRLDALDQANYETPSDELEAYQTAYGDFVRGDYGLAVTGFRGFLQLFASSNYASDSHYYLAESYFNLSEFEAATEEYNRVISDYPDSSYGVNSIYKKGLAFLESNQTAQGVMTLQLLINSHPGSVEARKAREKLRNLGLNPR